MPAPTAAAGTQRCRDVVVFNELRLGAGIVTTKNQCGDQRHRHDVGIGKVALRIIVMVQGTKHIGTDAIDGYNVRVQEAGLLKGKREHLNVSAFFMNVAR
jgi:hypothetical protein